MTTLKTFSLLIILLVTATIAAPQGARRSPRRTTSARPASAPANTVADNTPQPATTPAAPRGPVTLAVVNGQNITTAEIDASVREELDKEDDRVAEARRQVIELQ